MSAPRLRVGRAMPTLTLSVERTRVVAPSIAVKAYCRQKLLCFEERTRGPDFAVPQTLFTSHREVADSDDQVAATEAAVGEGSTVQVDVDVLEFLPYVRRQRDAFEAADGIEDTAVRGRNVVHGAPSLRHRLGYRIEPDGVL